MSDPKQALWDQLLARAWIENEKLGFAIGNYRHMAGAELPAKRFPPTYYGAIPVRAVIAANCPKLSEWLWKQPMKYLRTSAGEDRVVRLLKQHDKSASFLSLRVTADRMTDDGARFLELLEALKRAVAREALANHNDGIEHGIPFNGSSNRVDLRKELVRACIANPDDYLVQPGAAETKPNAEQSPHATAASESPAAPDLIRWGEPRPIAAASADEWQAATAAVPLRAEIKPLSASAINGRSTGRPPRITAEQRREVVERYRALRKVNGSKRLGSFVKDEALALDVTKQTIYRIIEAAEGEIEAQTQQRDTRSPAEQQRERFKFMSENKR